MRRSAKALKVESGRSGEGTFQKEGRTERWGKGREMAEVEEEEGHLLTRSSRGQKLGIYLEVVREDVHVPSTATPRGHVTFLGPTLSDR